MGRPSAGLGGRPGLLQVEDVVPGDLPVGDGLENGDEVLVVPIGELSRRLYREKASLRLGKQFEHGDAVPGAGVAAQARLLRGRGVAVGLGRPGTTRGSAAMHGLQPMNG